MSTIRIKGMEKTLRKFRALPPKVQAESEAKIVKAAAIVFRDAARRLAPRRKGPKGGQLRKDIRVQKISRAKQQPVRYGVSWRVGKASRTAAFYGLFFHKGAQGRQRKGKRGTIRTTASTGSMPRRPFLTQAFDESLPKAKRKMQLMMKAVIETEARSG